MGKNRKSSGVAYQNKDIISKVLGDGMRGKPLSVMGWKTDLTVERIEQTNLPAVTVNELRIDHLYVLSDGSVAIIGYESAVKKENILKYLDYVVRILRRLEVGPGTKIRVMVLYTADVETAIADCDVGCLQFHVKNAYLTGVDSQQWLEDVSQNVENQNIDYETQVRLIMLPLTYKGSDAKGSAIEQCVDLATRIEDNETQEFVLAGILAFTDKVITEEMRKVIKRRIRMIRIIEEFVEEGRAEGTASTLVNNVESLMRELAVSLERACQLVGTTVNAYRDAKEFLSK